MSTIYRTRRPGTGLALAAVLGLGSSFGLMAPAVADNGNGNGNGNGHVSAPAQAGQGAPQGATESAPESAPQSGADQGNGNGNPGKSEGKSEGNNGNGNPGKSEGKSGSGNPGKSEGKSGNGNPGESEGNNGNGPKADNGSSGGNSGGTPGTGAGAPNDEPADGPTDSDPAGNNGTIKIAGPDDLVGHPSNNPHPGCTFLVEWYGFDAGDDVVSTVSFASQAPTADVVLGGTTPSTVFVGEDAAGGGTDLDGRQAYTLTFTGEPHPQQGYHVKLTVSTPRSNGNDTKSKVFWVAPCTTPPATTPEVPPVTTVVPPTTTVIPSTTTVVPPTVLGEQATEESEEATTQNTTEENTAAEQAPAADVLGVQAAAAGAAATQGVLGSTSAVPTVINAGVAGKEIVEEMSPTQSALALLMLLLAGASARLAWTRRAGA